MPGPDCKNNTQLSTLTRIPNHALPHNIDSFLYNNIEAILNNRPSRNNLFTTIKYATQPTPFILLNGCAATGKARQALWAHNACSPTGASGINFDVDESFAAGQQVGKSTVDLVKTGSVEGFSEDVSTDCINLVENPKMWYTLDAYAPGTAAAWASLAVNIGVMAPLGGYGIYSSCEGRAECLEKKEVLLKRTLPQETVIKNLDTYIIAFEHFIEENEGGDFKMLTRAKKRLALLKCIRTMETHTLGTLEYALKQNGRQFNTNTSCLVSSSAISLKIIQSSLIRITSLLITETPWLAAATTGASIFAITLLDPITAFATLSIALFSYPKARAARNYFAQYKHLIDALPEPADSVPEIKYKQVSQRKYDAYKKFWERYERWNLALAVSAGAFTLNLSAKAVIGLTALAGFGSVVASPILLGTLFGLGVLSALSMGACFVRIFFLNGKNERRLGYQEQESHYMSRDFARVQALYHSFLQNKGNIASPSRLNAYLCDFLSERDQLIMDHLLEVACEPNEKNQPWKFFAKRWRKVDELESGPPKNEASRSRSTQRRKNVQASMHFIKTYFKNFSITNSLEAAKRAYIEQLKDKVSPDEIPQTNEAPQENRKQPLGKYVQASLAFTGAFFKNLFAGKHFKQAKQAYAQHADSLSVVDLAKWHANHNVSDPANACDKQVKKERAEKQLKLIKTMLEKQRDFLDKKIATSNASSQEFDQFFRSPELFQAIATQSRLPFQEGPLFDFEAETPPTNTSPSSKFGTETITLTVLPNPLDTENDIPPKDPQENPSSEFDTNEIIETTLHTFAGVALEVQEDQENMHFIKKQIADIEALLTPSKDVETTKIEQLDTEALNTDLNHYKETFLNLQGIKTKNHEDTTKHAAHINKHFANFLLNAYDLSTATRGMLFSSVQRDQFELQEKFNTAYAEINSAFSDTTPSSQRSRSTTATPLTPQEDYPHAFPSRLVTT